MGLKAVETLGDNGKAEVRGQTGRSLTMAERIALETMQGRIAQAQAGMQALLRDMGLDPNKSWRMTPEGVITEA